MSYSDGQIITGTGSATANTEASLQTHQIPAGQVWVIRKIWCGTDGAGGGTYRLKIPTYPQANFSYVQEGLSSNSVAVATSQTTGTLVSIPIVGPSSIEGLVSNTDTSAVSSIQLYYDVANGGATN